MCILKSRTGLVVTITVLTTLLFVAASIFIVSQILFSPYTPPEKFCTLDDIVYQMIADKGSTWAEEFRSRTIPIDVEMSFTTSNGGRYLVSTDLWDIWNEQPPRLLVVMDQGWNERLGSVGYIYSPGGETSFDKYRVEYLAGDVYCYWRENEFVR